MPWTAHPNFKEIISSSWERGSNILEAIKCFQQATSKWNTEMFGHIGKKKRTLLARLNGIHRALEQRSSNHLRIIEAELLKEYENILMQEELLWFQKSRREWIQFGDRNIKYYRYKTKARQHRNMIEMLKLDEIKWTSDSNRLKEGVVEFFNDLILRMKQPYLNIQ